MKILNKLPRVASIVAFLGAAIIALAGLFGPIVILPFAIIPLCAGVGILRKRAWSAYGFAIFLFAQLLLIPIVILRPRSYTGHLGLIIANAIGSLLLGILFLMAGRSLSAAGATRGRTLPWIAAAALSTTPFFFVQPWEIPGGSMEDTLLTGDRILAQTFPVHPPERGNIVLFISPADRRYTLVKRVIAIPGDRIRISRKVVILNGSALDEKYVVHNGADDFYPEDLPSDFSDFDVPECIKGQKMLSQHVANGEIVVPAGEYFVLGDNRENSLDSRCWGFVGSDDLVGKPLMIYDSIDQTPEQASDPKGNWLGHRRWARLFRTF